jgi:hypothetical protein
MARGPYDFVAGALAVLAHGGRPPGTPLAYGVIWWQSHASDSGYL